MKNIYAFALVILGLIFGLRAAAQNQANITGTILDEKGKPTEFVTVALLNAADSSLVKTALTDAKGLFFFNINPPKGLFYIKASSMGYQLLKSETLALDSTHTAIDFGKMQLVAQSKNLQEVSVLGNKPLIERKLDKVVLNVANSSIAVGANALELLQKAPGVSVNQNDQIALQGKQGVIIMIDGKLTYLSNADVANMLRSMQSSEIETIELITNPSSKYDAAGNSGIINIKTKKGKTLGTNGSVNAGARAGRYFGGNSGLSINHREKKLSFYADYANNYYKNYNRLAIDRVAAGNPDTYFSQISDGIRDGYNHNLKTGIDYFINAKNTLSFLFNGSYFKPNEGNNSRTFIGQSFTQVDSVLTAPSTDSAKYRRFTLNLNYKVILDSTGAELVADFDYGKFKGTDLSNYTNQYLNPDGVTPLRPAVLTRNNTPNTIGIKTAKIDYNVNLTKSLKLEAGLKSSWVKTDNNLFAELQTNGVFNNDPRRSNQFVYDENINAAYANLNKTFKNTTIQLGLRVEQTVSTGNLITTNNVVKRNYTNLFPTLFIQQTLSENHVLGLSFGRRIDRPSYEDLNPFVYFIDDFTYNQGNPFLKPQYTNNIELNYMFKQKYSLTLAYSRTTDIITAVILPDVQTKALFQTNANISNSTNLSANLNVPIVITKWWSSNNNILAFRNQFNSPNLAGQNLKSGRFSTQLKSINSFKLVAGVRGELTGNFFSPVDNGTLTIKSLYFVDAGLSKSFLQKKLDVKLALSDIFNTFEFKLRSTYPGFDYIVSRKNESRIFRIGLSYRFGKSEVKPAEKRSTGSEEEQSRMKN